MKLVELINRAFHFQRNVYEWSLREIVTLRSDQNAILLDHYPCENCRHHEMRLMDILTPDEWNVIEGASVNPSLVSFDRLIDVYLRLDAYVDELVRHGPGSSGRGVRARRDVGVGGRG